MIEVQTVYFRNSNSPYLKIQPSHYRITPSQGEVLLRQAVPLTHPYTDLQGQTIQLWKFQSFLVASIHTYSDISIVSGSRILNPLQQNENHHDLLRRLENGPLKRWQFSYCRNTSKIMIWPFLEAAGREEHFQKNLDACEQKFEKYKKDLSLGDAEDRRRAAWRENRGEVLSLKSDGSPHDHKKKVQFIQDGLKKRIAYLKDILGESDLKGAQRRQAESLLSEFSKMLKDSERYVPSRGNKMLGYSARQSARLAKLGLTAALMMSNSLFGKTPATAQFRQVLQQTHLTQSYNGNNPGKAVPARGMSSGQIGGVGHNVGMIEGLFENPESIFDTEHFFGVKREEGDLPFSNEELQLILRELAIGIYAHDTVWIT